MCSNSLCKKFTVACMHETARRLLASGLAKGAKDFTAIAKSLGGSDQSATNWKKRGVPKQVLIAAATKIGVDIAWLTADPSAQEPPFITRWREGREPAPVECSTPYRPRLEEARTGYVVDPDEQIVIDAFRMGDDGFRSTILLLARDLLLRTGKRVGNHR